VGHRRHAFHLLLASREREIAYEGHAMKIGFHLTPFWSPTERGATQIIDGAIEVAAASRMGCGWVSIGQHWISTPPRGLDKVGVTIYSLPLPVRAGSTISR